MNQRPGPGPGFFWGLAYAVSISVVLWTVLIVLWNAVWQ